MTRYYMIIQEIVRIQSALRLEKLGLRAFNKKACWEIDQETLKGLKS